MTAQTLPAETLTAALVDYARRFHADVDTARASHHVASPLGAWLLLALAGTAAPPQARADLVKALGVDIDDAASTAAELLDHPHPLVGAAAAMWHRPEAATDALRAWEPTLPTSVETGPIPSQDHADSWANEKTLGLIERFPLAIGPDLLLILATALATKISWDVPFNTVPASELGNAWPDVKTLLETPSEGPHYMAIVGTDTVGDVAIHSAGVRDGLAVTSVSADPSMPATEVLAAAHTVAVAHATRQEIRTKSLFDLPLGDGHSWRLSERQTSDKASRREVFQAILPAWQAESSHNLIGAVSLGFPALVPTFDVLVGPGPTKALQKALARYTREGFEAAAITVGARALSYSPPQQITQRAAELRFDHPYAVVAVTLDERWVDGEQRTGPWHGVPVFSAWVAKATDAG